MTMGNAKKSRDHYASKIKGHYYGNWQGLFTMFKYGHNDIDWLNSHIDAAMEQYASQQVIKGKIEVLEEMKYTDKQLRKMKEPVCSTCVVFNMKLNSKISQLKTQLENEQD